MPDPKDTPKLPLVQKDTILSTLVPMIESDPCVMDDYIDGILQKIETENPHLYTILASKYDQIISTLNDESAQDETIDCVASNVWTMMAMMYCLLESQLEVDHLNQKFGLTNPGSKPC